MAEEDVLLNVFMHWSPNDGVGQRAQAWQRMEMQVEQAKNELEGGPDFL